MGRGQVLGLRVRLRVSVSTMLQEKLAASQTSHAHRRPSPALGPGPRAAAPPPAARRPAAVRIPVPVRLSTFVTGWTNVLGSIRANARVCRAHVQCRLCRHSAVQTTSHTSHMLSTKAGAVLKATRSLACGGKAVQQEAPRIVKIEQTDQGHLPKASCRCSEARRARCSALHTQSAQCHTSAHTKRPPPDLPGRGVPAPASGSG